MGGGFTPEVKRLLAAAGCIYERPGKGDHEIWYSPVTKRRFPVDHKILSRHTAWLEARECRVLRFWNTEVFENPEGVTEVILRAASAPTVQPPS